MRPINLIVIHCSATIAGRDIRAADVRRWHKQENKWSDIGYHYFIRIDGTIETGRPVEKVGAHAYPFNTPSIGVCYAGGISREGRSADTRTDAQKAALTVLIKSLAKQYPNAKIVGHRDLSPDKDKDGVVERHEWLKDCPCFDVAEWCRSVGIDPK